MAATKPTGEPLNSELRYASVLGKGWTVEESLAAVEFIRTSDNFLAKVQSALGGVREYRGSTFEQVLEQVIIDLQEEFEIPA